jgi:XTP/dITP diphosphohydrolase
MTDHPQLDELIAVLARLRAPGGCAWDAEQTHASLVQYLVEETFELVDAIESGTRDDLIEELGDVLYQVLFHADIAASLPEGSFTIEDVAARSAEKMIGRHPHVFGDTDASTSAEVIALWDEVKKVEKPGRTSVLDGIPQSMPALSLADKLVGKAHKVGAELEAIEVPETESELGAALLGMVAGAHAKGLDSERALRSALRVLQEEIRSREAGGESEDALGGEPGAATAV